MQLLVVLDPITSLLFHLLHDFITLVTNQVLLDDFPGGLEIIHELHASLSSLLLGLSHLGNRVTHLILHSHGTAGHSEEVKFFLSQFFNLLARQNTLNALLNKKSSCILFLFSGLLLNKAFTNLFVKLSLDTLLLKGFYHKHDTVATLTTSLILLNQTDGICNTELNRKWVLDDLSLWLC
jgi:hypothetical protein